MTGRVAALFRWPGKGFGGERLDRLVLAGHGVEGDRVHVLRSRGKKLTALGAPKLLRWTATPGGVRGPDGHPWGWEEPGLIAALAEDLGRPVELEAHPGGRPDVPGTVLVTVESSRRAMEQALGDPLDVRRFRPNLHLELDAPAWAEEEWVGRRLRVGEAELEIDHLCDRCAVTTREPDTGDASPGVLKWINAERGTYFGVRARVVRPGPVAEGDPVG